MSRLIVVPHLALNQQWLYSFSSQSLEPCNGFHEFVTFREAEVLLLYLYFKGKTPWIKGNQSFSVTLSNPPPNTCYCHITASLPISGSMSEQPILGICTDNQAHPQKTVTTQQRVAWGSFRPQLLFFFLRWRLVIAHQCHPSRQMDCGKVCYSMNSAWDNSYIMDTWDWRMISTLATSNPAACSSKHKKWATLELYVTRWEKRRAGWDVHHLSYVKYGCLDCHLLTGDTFVLFVSTLWGLHEQCCGLHPQGRFKETH